MSDHLSRSVSQLGWIRKSHDCTLGSLGNGHLTHTFSDFLKTASFSHLLLCILFTLCCVMKENRATASRDQCIAKRKLGKRQTQTRAKYLVHFRSSDFSGFRVVSKVVIVENVIFLTFLVPVECQTICHVQSISPVGSGKAMTVPLYRLETGI